MKLKKGDRVNWDPKKGPSSVTCGSGIVENLLPKKAAHVSLSVDECEIADICIVWITTDEGNRIGLIPEKIMMAEGKEIEDPLIGELWGS
jgi:hypothetical protein